MPTKWQKRMFPPSYPQRTLTFDNHQWIKDTNVKRESMGKTQGDQVSLKAETKGVRLKMRSD